MYSVTAELCLLGSTYGASLCARTAVDAGISVNYVYAVALRYSLYGTLSCASTATDAIFSNLKCHG